MKVEFCILLVAVLTSSAAGHEQQAVEARGKAKFALLIHFFYVVATKLFVLKLVYGAIFYVLIVKGWRFVSWFIHYLKEKKHDHHEYVEYHEPYHGHHEHEYGHIGHHEQGYYGHQEPVSYGSDSNYGPYVYKKQGYSASAYKKAYDADGSYSVKRVNNL